jgi:hypothetical protein
LLWTCLSLNFMFWRLGGRKNGWRLILAKVFHKPGGLLLPICKGPQRWSCNGQGHIIVYPQRSHQSFVSKFVVLFLMSSYAVLDICQMFSSFSLKPLLVVER